MNEFDFAVRLRLLSNRAYLGNGHASLTTHGLFLNGRDITFYVDEFPYNLKQNQLEERKL